MIFKPELARLVMQGKKTATRRPANGAPCRYQVGRDYAVQPGRGKSAVGRINVVDVERQVLGDLTFNDARAEGFRTTADFARYWLTLYDPELVLPAAGDDVLELWRERYARAEVWAITFELGRPVLISVPEKPLYLHRRVHRPPTTDPSQRAIGEPEIIDIAFAREHRSIARARHVAQHQDQAMRRRASDLGGEVRKVLLEGLRAGADVEPAITAIQRAISSVRHATRAA